MVEASVSGAEGFLALSKALKEAGRGELRKQLNKDLREAVKPLIPKTRAEARRTLPKRGGYAVLVAKATQRVQVRTGQATAGVRLIVVNDKSSARRANRGVLRHPVFGNREAWVNQPLATHGWFDRPAKAEHPKIVEAALDAITHVIDEIAKEAR